TIHRSASPAVANLPSGTGTLTQPSSPTRRSSDLNTYSGITTINAGGTLQVGNGGATGNLGTGSVTDNGTLAFNRTAALTVASLISGTRTLKHPATSTISRCPANTYTGTTTINARS